MSFTTTKRTTEVSQLTALEMHNACGRKLSWSVDRHLCVAARGAYPGAEVITEICGSLGFEDEWILTMQSKHNKTRLRLASAPHLCMSAMKTGQRIFPGSKLQLQSCSDMDHTQHFAAINGTIRWKDMDMCVDVQYGKDAAITPLQLWHCIGGKSQLFEPWPCKEKCFRQIHFKRHPGMCLTTSGWHLKDPGNCFRSL